MRFLCIGRVGVGFEFGPQLFAIFLGARVGESITAAISSSFAGTVKLLLNVSESSLVVGPILSCPDCWAGLLLLGLGDNSLLPLTTRLLGSLHVALLLTWDPLLVSSLPGKHLLFLFQVGLDVRCTLGCVVVSWITPTPRAIWM